MPRPVVTKEGYAARFPDMIVSKQGDQTVLSCKYCKVTINHLNNTVTRIKEHISTKTHKSIKERVQDGTIKDSITRAHRSARTENDVN